MQLEDGLRAMIRPFSLRNAARYKPLGVNPQLAQRAQREFVRDLAKLVESKAISMVTLRDVKKQLSEDAILKQVQEASSDSHRIWLSSIMLERKQKM
jgi:arginase family enzyme